MAYIGNYPAETQTVDLKWQSVKTASFTAVAGEGYWINTTSGAVTVTLPASANAGDTIEFSDYARNWGTNSITLNPNSLNFQGNTSPNPEYNTNGQSVRIIYSGATQGWIPTTDDDVTLETPQPYSADFLVIGGGGGSAMVYGGGGGAGGYRNSYASETSGRGSPSESSLTLSPGTVYTITVGAGGIGAQNYGGEDSASVGINGDDSSISGSGITTITSLGGGGAGRNYQVDGKDGGCGGGGGSGGAGGSGTANQGYDGGDASTNADGYAGGGGGGAGAIGGSSTSNSSNGGAGGTGLSFFNNWFISNKRWWRRWWITRWWNNRNWWNWWWWNWLCWNS
jgi:hypothetical protein